MAWRSGEHQTRHSLWNRRRGDRRAPKTPHTFRRIDPFQGRRAGEAHPTRLRRYAQCPTRSCRRARRAAPPPVALRPGPGAPEFRALPSHRTLRPSNRLLVRVRPEVVRGVLHTNDLRTCIETIAARLKARRGDVRLRCSLDLSCRETQTATSQPADVW